MKPNAPATMGADKTAEAVRQWMAAGHPAVVRRHETLETEAGGAGIALGIPLPARMGRQRLAFRVSAGLVERHAKMPLLKDAASCVSADWIDVVRSVDARISGCGARARAFGSLGWQFITGETYLHPGSDMDILIEPMVGFDSEAGLAVFASIAALDNPRFDGEVILAHDRAVAWRELCAGHREVLVRTRRDLRLCCASDVIAAMAIAGHR
ncbi:MAG: malonate decarboxylase holo-[acyl-carrier-protein] synthase [Burkholderiales bacterium]|nr:malonate decarboxylase holo-[acyl-carrier-protein] synthase [Burkholderiales bacterium]